MKERLDVRVNSGGFELVGYFIDSHGIGEYQFECLLGVYLDVAEMSEVLSLLVGENLRAGVPF